jgi:hypothetical protein
MSMLPIDMSITVQRTVDMPRTPTGEATARPELAQDEFADRFSREVKQQQEQVNQSAKSSEESTINRDGRGNSGFASGKRKNEKEKKGHKQEPQKAGSNGSLFDVSI